MSKSHAKRLALWKEKQRQEKINFVRSDINRIVAMIDRVFYSSAEPRTEQRTRISGRVRRTGGE